MSWRTRIAAVLILAIVVTSAPWPAGWIPEALADPPAPLAAATDRTAVGGGQIPNPDQAGVVERAQSRVTTGTFAAKDGPRFTGQVAHQEPFDGATGISLTPTLSVINLGIPATTALEYEFKVFTAAGTQVYPRQGTDPVRQPSSRLTVPGGVLAPETSYRWEVTAVDGAETVYESRENAWWFSTALWVDARPGARVTTPAHGATVTTTTPRVDLGFTRPTNGTVTVGRVVVTDMDTNAEVWASSWSSSTQVAVPAGHLGWFRRYEIRAWAARQGEESTPGLHSSSRIEVTTAVPSDGIELLRDAGPRYQQVSMTTGGFTEDVLDAQVQSVGPPLAIGRSYRSVTTSGASSVGVFGAGWSTWLDMGVRELPTGVVIVRTAGGHEEAFAPNGSGGYVGSQATASVLVSLGSGRWEWTENLQRYEIGAEGIRKITAPNNFVTSVERDQGKIVRLVDDRSGRVLALSWAGDRIAAVEARPSRNVASTVRWQYTYAADRLIEACAPHGRGDQSCTTYIYADTANPSAITQITDPMGAARAKISYGVRGQVREVEDAVGEIRRFERTPIIGGVQPGTAVTIKTVSGVRLVGYRLNDQGQPVQQVTWPTGQPVSQTWDYDWRGRQYTYVGPDNARTDWRYATAQGTNPVLITERRAAATETTPELVIDRRFDYTWSGQVAVEWDPRTEHAATQTKLNEYTYSYFGAGPGLVRTHRTGDGAESENEFTTMNTPAVGGGGYMPVGLLKAAVDPTGGRSEYRYRVDGLLASSTAPDGLESTYTYDSLGRMTAVRVAPTGDPGGRVTTFELGDDGRILTQTAPDITDSLTAARQIRIETGRDRAGRVTSVTSTDLKSAKTATLTTTYDAAGRPTTVTGADQAVTTFEYGPAGCATAVVNAVGARTEQTCDLYGRSLTTTLANYTDPTDPGTPARVITLSETSYTPSGRVAAVTDAGGVRQNYTYSPDGLLLETSATPPVGAAVTETRLAYDAGGRVVDETRWPNNSSLRASAVTQYDAAGRVGARWARTESVTTPLGTVAGFTTRTRYGYDPTGRVVRIALDNGTDTGIARIDTAQFNAAGQLLSSGAGRVDDQTMAKTRYEYDSWGRLAAIMDPRANPTIPRDPAYTSLITYNEDDQPVTLTGPEVTITQSNGTSALGRPITRTGYDAFGRPSVAVDPNGATTTTEYDLNGRTTKITAPESPTTTGPAAAVDQYTYDAVGRLATQTNPAGATTTLAYDSRGNLARVQAPPLTPGGSARVSTTRFNDAGLPVRSVDPAGVITTASYDAWGQLTSETLTENSRNLTTSYGYDLAGNPTSTTSPAGAITTMVFNNRGEPVATTDPDGVTIATHRDLEGRPTRTIDELGRTSVTAYDHAGRVEATSVTAGSTVHWRDSIAYDAAGNPTSVTRPLGTGWTAQYNGANQLIATVMPDSATYQYGYDATGRRTAITSPTNKTLRTSYTPVGQIAKVVETAASPLADGTWETGYDIMGRPVTSSRPGGVNVTRAFDAAGNLTSETGTAPSTATVQHAYSYHQQTGQLTGFSHPAGTQTLAYNARGLLTSSTGPAGNAQFSYDDDGRPTNRVDASGTTTFSWTPAGRAKTTSTSGGLSRTHTYDAAGRPTSIAHGDGITRTLTMDPLNQVTGDSLTRTDNSEIFGETATYDQAGRKTSITRTPNTVAGAGTIAYTYDTRDRLLAAQGPGSTSHAYSYDASSNLTNMDGKPVTRDSRERITAIGSTVYAWSPQGTQTSRTEASQTTNRSYDPFDRLISETDTTAGTTSFTYDALDRLATATTGTTATGFSYGATDDQPARIGNTPIATSASGSPLGTGSTSWHADGQNNIAAATGDSGAVTGSRAFSPYGTVTDSQGDPVSDLGYRGDYTAPTGITRMGARWYDPDSGTFLTRDPLTGIAPAESNTAYGYAAGNPVTFSDPTGLISIGPLPPVHNPSPPKPDPTRPVVTASTLSIFVPPVRRSTTAAKTSSSTRTTTTTKTTTRTATQTRTTSYAKPAPPPRRDVYTEVGARDGVPALPVPPERAPVVQGPGTDSAAPPGNTHNSAVPTTITPPASSGTPSGTNTPLPPTQPTCHNNPAIWIMGGTICPDSLPTGADHELMQHWLNLRALINRGADSMPAVNLPKLPIFEDLADFSDEILSKYERLKQIPGLGILLSITSINPMMGPESVVDLLHLPRLFDTATTPMNSFVLEGICRGIAVVVCATLLDGPNGDIAKARSEAGLEIGLAVAFKGRASGAKHRINESIRKGRNLLRGCPNNSFDYDTPVLMADGSTKPIGEVELGDRVWATDPETGERGPRAVIDLIRHAGLHTMVQIELANGETIDATDEHPFWVVDRQAPDGTSNQGQWVDAINLNPGDQLLDANSNTIKVANLTITAKDLTAYNLTIAGLHTYHVSDDQVLVHNCDLGESIAEHMGKRRFSDVHGDTAEYIEHVIHGNAPLAEFKQVSASGRGVWRDGKNIIIVDPMSPDGGTGFSKATVEDAKKFYENFK